MAPEEAMQMQVRLYQQLTPAQRLRIGLELHDLMCKVALAGIRSQFPNVGPEGWQRELARRLELARS